MLSWKVFTMNQKTLAELAQKTALDLNDLQRTWHRATGFGVRHGGDIASLRPREKRKLDSAEVSPKE